MAAKYVHYAEDSKLSSSEPLATSTPKNAEAKTAELDAKPVHPKASVMVNEAIKKLAGRRGTSLHAIYKYIRDTYNFDISKQMIVRIKQYLKKAITDGSILNTTGTGLSGSFKMPSARPAKRKTTQENVATTTKPTTKKTGSETAKIATKKKVTTKIGEKSSAIVKKSKSAKATETKTAPKNSKKN